MSKLISSVGVFGDLIKRTDNHGFDINTRFVKCNLCGQVEAEQFMFEHLLLCHSESERLKFYQEYLRKETTT